MTFSRDFFAFLSCTAMIVVLQCEADRCPPPTNLAFKWLDEFTVNVSWKNSSDLPHDKNLGFLVTSADAKPLRRTKWSNFTESFFTEDKRSDHWTYNIHQRCNGSEPPTLSPPVPITIKTIKNRAELVTDFKCFISTNKMNCSWTPARQSLNLTVTYRICGSSEDDRKTRKECNVQVRGNKSGCILDIETTPNNICILVQTEAAMNTFHPVLVVNPPELNVTESGDYLLLNWTTPDFESPNCWIYNVCYTECNKTKPCRATRGGGSTMMVPYDKNCQYEFRSKVSTTDKCPRICSEYSAPVFYGTTVPPDVTLYVVAAVIAVILSACFVLSCYCFRRHSAIICPIIPDPSAIFKEMIMMNGNKDMKPPTGSLYTPVPEPFEPCKISPLTENSSLQENS